MFSFKCEVLEKDGLATLGELELYAISPEEAAKTCLRFYDHIGLYRPMVTKATIKVTGLCHKYEGFFERCKNDGL